MARQKTVGAIGSLVVSALLFGPTPARAAPLAEASGALDDAYLDKLLAPVALYPDQLLAQMLLCAANPRKVGELSAWLKENSALKGSEMQSAAESAGFEPSFVALAPFPQVVDFMAGNATWTSQLGGAFAVDRGGVFDSIQRLRKQSEAAGNLKSTPQQTVKTETTQAGEQAIVIEPANPQVVYVPQYDPVVVYTQPTSTTVIVHEDHDDEAAAAVIGFAAGVAIGAAFDNHYYYGPYGWRGGAYMYNDPWDDWYDDRNDAREDWYENRSDAREDFYENREDARDNLQDNREDMAGERSDRAENAREQRTERQQTRGTSESQAQRDQRRAEAQGRAQEARASGGTERAQASTTSASTQRTGGERTTRAADRTSTTAADRSGTRSDAFSGYSSNRSTRDASSRGQRSRSSSGGSSRSRRK